MDEASPITSTTESAEPAPASPASPSLIGTLLLGFFAPLFTSLAATIIVLVVAACLPGAPRTRKLVEWALLSAPGMAALLLLQNALLGLWAWALSRDRELPRRTWLRLRPARLAATDFILLLFVAFGVFGFGALAALAVRGMGVSDFRAIERFIEIFRVAPGISWLVLVLAMGLGPGFGEEMWVRGHVLRALGQRLRPRTAILLSAIVFALLHLDPATILFALPFGLVFGWLAIRTDSILPGILCHILVNSSVNLIRAIEVRRPGYDLALHPLTIERRDVLLMLGLAAAGVIAGVALERRLRAAPVTGLAGAQNAIVGPPGET